MPVIPVLGRWRQEDHKFEDSLGAYRGVQGQAGVYDILSLSYSRVVCAKQFFNTNPHPVAHNCL